MNSLIDYVRYPAFCAVVAIAAAFALPPGVRAQYEDGGGYGERPSRSLSAPAYDDFGETEIHGPGSDPGGVHGHVAESSRLGEQTEPEPLGMEQPMARRPFKLPNVEVPESDYEEVVPQTEIFGAEAGTAVRFPDRTGDGGEAAPAVTGRPRTVTGLFSVRNKYRRTFDIDGQAGVFVAPREENLYRLDRQQVTITFDENGEIAEITPEVPVD